MSKLEGIPSSRLVSLWEIMKPFFASAFLTAKGFLRNYEAFSLFGRIPLHSHGMSEMSRINQRLRDAYLKAWEGNRYDHIEAIERTEPGASWSNADRPRAYRA